MCTKPILRRDLGVRIAIFIYAVTSGGLVANNTQKYATNGRDERGAKIPANLKGQGPMKGRFSAQVPKGQTRAMEVRYDGPNAMRELPSLRDGSLDGDGNIATEEEVLT